MQTPSGENVDVFKGSDVAPKDADARCEEVTSSAEPPPPHGDRSAGSKERKKEEPLNVVSEPEVQGGQRVTATRPETRENEETRTPSSCSEGQIEQVRESDCDDAQECEDAPNEVPQRVKPLSEKSSSASAELERKNGCGRPADDDDEGIDLDSISPSGLAEGSLLGVPPAALIPHLSLPGLRGPRPSPALGAKMGRSASQPQQQENTAQVKGTGTAGGKGPLGDLMVWLTDADVGDVLDQFSLTDLLHSPSAQAQNADRTSFCKAAESRSPVQWVDGGHGETDDDVFQDDLEDVPSDKEGLPRAPPLASNGSPLMRPPTPEHPPKETTTSSHITGYCALPNNLHQEGPSEEDEWLARQRLTGAIGRLVKYAEGEVTPKDDILGLRCTSRGRIMVTAVRENGVAMRAGVAAGDELVSINGRKDFVGHPANVVHASLRAPVTLVFLGFVGKLQAEVRVKRPPEPKCGLAPHQDVINHNREKSVDAVAALCDAVVFKQGKSASLLIATASAGQAPDPSAEDPENAASHLKVDEQAAPKTIMYELQKEDARRMVMGSIATTAAL